MAEVFTVTVVGGKVPFKSFTATLDPLGDEGFAVQEQMGKAAWYVHGFYPITPPPPDPDKK